MLTFSHYLRFSDRQNKVILQCFITDFKRFAVKVLVLQKDDYLFGPNGGL